jgi:hypothetical protein
MELEEVDRFARMEEEIEELKVEVECKEKMLKAQISINRSFEER